MRWSLASLDALRWARCVLVTPPADEPVSLDEAKRHCRQTHTTDDDETIESLIIAARQKVEADTGRALVTQTFDVFMDGFPDGPILLPKGRLRSVTSLKAHDTGNVTSTVTSGDYLVDTASIPGRIVRNANGGWPQTRAVNGVEIRATFGYGEPEDVPYPLKQAMLLVIGSMFEHREQVIISQFAGQFIALPFGYDQLIAPYVLGGVA